MRKHKVRLFVAPADPTIDLRDDDLLQIEQQYEDWIHENQHRGDAKKIVLIHTREFREWPAELSSYFGIRLIDLDELGRVSEYYARGYKLVVYREHPGLQRLIHTLVECAEL